ncbi:MAG: hypothetical protein NVS1B1_02980 [Candidatus Limnocylindrales bacterium]
MQSGLSSARLLVLVIVLVIALGLGIFVATAATDDTGILAGIVLLGAAACAFVTPKQWGGIAILVGLPTLLVQTLRADAAAVIVLLIAALGAWIGSFVRTSLDGERASGDRRP